MISISVAFYFYCDARLWRFSLPCWRRWKCYCPLMAISANLWLSTSTPAIAHAANICSSLNGNKRRWWWTRWLRRQLHGADFESLFTQISRDFPQTNASISFSGTLNYICWRVCNRKFPLVAPVAYPFASITHTNLYYNRTRFNSISWAFVSASCVIEHWTFLVGLWLLL